MVKSSCFQPPGDLGLPKDCLRAKWRARVGLFVDLLGAELAEKFLNDVVWKDEVRQVPASDPSIIRLASADLPEWTGDRIDVLDVAEGSSEMFRFFGNVNGDELVLNWEQW